MFPMFVTADWHLHHKNILKFSQRPFKDIEEMHEKLINNYNSTVPETGICYFLGDIGQGSFQELKEIITSLNGTKILIKGNHDKKSYGFYYGVGFSTVMHSCVLYLGKNRISMSHCPLIGRYRENTLDMKGTNGGEDNWYGESRQSNYQYTLEASADFHFHGHIHAPNNGKSKPIEKNQFDMGVDANGYRPVSFSKINSLIDLYKKKISARPLF